MIKLIRLLIFVSNCQSLFLSPQENAERWKTCGIQNNPTTTPPRVLARDAPWMLTIRVFGTEHYHYGGAVLISRNVVVATSQAVFPPSQKITPEITASCQNGTSDILSQMDIQFIADTCLDQLCSQHDRLPIDQIDKVKVLGNCADFDTMLYFFHLKTPHQNAPICLPNNRIPVAGEPVMIHTQHPEGPKDIYKIKKLEMGKNSRWFGNKKEVITHTEQDTELWSSTMVRRNNNQFEMVGLSRPYFITYKSTFRGQLLNLALTMSRSGKESYNGRREMEYHNYFLNMQFYEKDVCKSIGICPPVVHESPTKISRLSDKEKEDRANNCGILKHPSVAASEPLTLARDAPWIVDVQTSHTHLTGFLISKRHVFVDGRLFKVFNSPKLFVNDKNWIVISSNLPNDPSDEFFVNVQLQVCADAGCKKTKRKDVMASKIVLWNYGIPFVVLELSSSVHGTPICLTNDRQQKGDIGFHQVFNEPGRLRDEVTLASNESWFSTIGASRVKSFSEVLVKKIDDRYFAIGFRSTYHSKYTSWKSMTPLHHQICDLINCVEKKTATVTQVTKPAAKPTSPTPTVTLASTKPPIVPTVPPIPVTTVTKPTVPSTTKQVPTTTQPTTVASTTTPTTLAPTTVIPTKPPTVKTTVPVPVTTTTVPTVPTTVAPTKVPPTTKLTTVPSTTVTPTTPKATVAPAPSPSTTVTQRPATVTEATGKAIGPTVPKSTVAPAPSPSIRVTQKPATVTEATGKAIGPTVPKSTVAPAPSPSIRVTQKPATVTEATGKAIGPTVPKSTVAPAPSPSIRVTQKPATVTRKPPLKLSKISAEENDERHESCGPEMSDEPVSFARDAPWIVQITTRGKESTGFLISKRHVLVDNKLFKQNPRKLFGGYKNTFTFRSLPTNETDPYFVKIVLEVCDQNGNCDDKKHPVKVPTRIAAIKMKPFFYILELAEDLRIPTVCIAESAVTKAGDEVIILNWAEEKSLSDVYKVKEMSPKGEIYIEKRWSKDSKLDVIVQRIKNRMVAVGFRPEKESVNATKWFGIGPISKVICDLTGVCPMIPKRETLAPRVRDKSTRDEFPDHPEFKDPIGEDDMEEGQDEEDEDEMLEMGEMINGSDKKLELLIWVFVGWFLVFE